MAVSKRTRYEVLARDNHTCRYCGIKAAESPLTIDHVTPVSLGGSDAPENLVAACKDCNAGKASSNPDAAAVAQVANDAIRWAAARKQAMQDVVYEQERLESLHEQAQEFFLSLWDSYTFTSMGFTADLPDDWTTTVNRWARDGVNFTSLVGDAVEIAMRNNSVPRKSKFVYFLGIMKNKLAEVDTRAQEIVAGPKPEVVSYNDLVMGALSRVVDGAA